MTVELCQAGFVRYEDSCYKSFGQNLPQTEAQTICQSHSQAHLVEINSQEEYEFINSWIGGMYKPNCRLIMLNITTIT